MADVESSMGGKFDKQAIPREARRLWAKLLQEPLRSEEALRGEVEAYSVLIEKVALKKEFFDQTTARRLTRISLRVLDAWGELDEEARVLAQAAIRYFVVSEDGDDDFESPTGLDDDDAVMKAVLQHLGRADLLGGSV